MPPSVLRAREGRPQPQPHTPDGRPRGMSESTCASPACPVRRPGALLTPAVRRRPAVPENREWLKAQDIPLSPSSKRVGLHRAAPRLLDDLESLVPREPVLSREVVDLVGLAGDDFPTVRPAALALSSAIDSFSASLRRTRRSAHLMPTTGLGAALPSSWMKMLGVSCAIP
jgi:hypothetical protein